VKSFAAEVLFFDKKDVPDAVKTLGEVDCDLRIDPDVKDPFGPTVFGMVTGTTKLEIHELGDWLRKVLRPVGGDLVEWAYGPPWKIGD
jgi:hypothetical protein